MAAPGEDQPVLVGGGGPHHITLQVAEGAGYEPKTFSITPKDPAVPFKEIVIMDGATEIIRWPLSDDWKITIA